MDTLYNDLAIILAWPDATIRGDEGWMMWFRRLGVVKNLNFKVGHTAIILVEPVSGKLLLYDFGRYIAPRGLGRARSPFSDPRLVLRTRAEVIDLQYGEIGNLSEIAAELETIQDATKGEGRLFFSVATGINFDKAKDYADNLVLEGSSPYGAFARGNNNCSRFITRVLMHSSKKYHLLHGVNLPETIKASPLSNVVNVRKDRDIFTYDNRRGLERRRMSRLGSLCFLLRQLSDNFISRRAKFLPADEIPGSVSQLPKPDGLPVGAQWLGGVGEGAWYLLKTTDLPNQIEVTRYTEEGILEYTVAFFSSTNFDKSKPYRIVHDSHMLYTTIRQGEQTIRFQAKLNTLTHSPEPLANIRIPDSENLLIPASR